MRVVLRRWIAESFLREAVSVEALFLMHLRAAATVMSSIARPASSRLRRCSSSASAPTSARRGSGDGQHLLLVRVHRSDHARAYLGSLRRGGELLQQSRQSLDLLLAGQVEEALAKGLAVARDERGGGHISRPPSLYGGSRTHGRWHGQEEGVRRASGGGCTRLRSAHAAALRRSSFCQRRRSVTWVADTTWWRARQPAGRRERDGHDAGVGFWHNEAGQGAPGGPCGVLEQSRKWQLAEIVLGERPRVRCSSLPAPSGKCREAAWCRRRSRTERRGRGTQSGPRQPANRGRVALKTGSQKLGNCAGRGFGGLLGASQ